VKKLLITVAAFIAPLCYFSRLYGQASPFSLEIVPAQRSIEFSVITTGNNSNQPFYVILTNLTDKVQNVFETWNSWGYQTLSFVMTLPGGKKTTLTVKEHGFTMNFPSTFSIPPKGHFVFPVIFDKEWVGFPDFGKPGHTQVKLKAIYTVKPYEEDKPPKGWPKHEPLNVWVGSVASEELSVDLNHW
jgi:hypothetical protein